MGWILVTVALPVLAPMISLICMKAFPLAIPSAQLALLNLVKDGQLCWAAIGFCTSALYEMAAPCPPGAGCGRERPRLSARDHDLPVGAGKPVRGMRRDPSSHGRLRGGDAPVCPLQGPARIAQNHRAVRELVFVDSSRRICVGHLEIGMSNWLKERFSDPNRAMDTICIATSAACALIFVLGMILLLVLRYNARL